jgi:UDP-glucose 4-epimerase
LGITVRCMRYFNVYGPRQDPKSPYSGVISIFSDKLRAGEAPTIFGDGENTRDFVSVHDVARANVLAATQPVLSSGVTNICTGKPTSLNELARILRTQFEDAQAPKYVESRAGDIRHSLGAPDRAKRELGWEPTVSLDQGLAELAT